jgi:hypothetical protein
VSRAKIKLQPENQTGSQTDHSESHSHSNHVHSTGVLLVQVAFCDATWVLELAKLNPS